MKKKVGNGTSYFFYKWSGDHYYYTQKIIRLLHFLEICIEDSLESFCLKKIAYGKRKSNLFNKTLKSLFWVLGKK